MQPRHFLCLLQLLLLLFLVQVPVNEARGGRRGGGGMFGAWRKIKKPSSSSSSSSRRMQGHKSEVPYTPLKSSPSFNSRTSAGYPKQMPAGATYHASSAHLPRGATYHGVAVPPGGNYLASGVAMPPGAVYIPQAPPHQSSFSTTHFLMGMYAGHMLGHGLVGHRTVVHHVYNDSQQQQQQQDKNKVIIIENGAAAGNESVPVPPALWPTDTDVPLAPFNTTITPLELLYVSTEPIYHRNTQQPQEEEQLETTPASPPSAGIICMPLLVNETVDGSIEEVEKTVCYPAPPLPEDGPTLGIICVPQMVMEVDATDHTKTIEIEKQSCYPAPPVPESEEEEFTKSPDSVIGNITAEGDEASREQQLNAALKSLSEEERLAMKDILTEHQN